MQTIIVIARRGVWEKALQSGSYTQSTINSTLDEIGFIHCTIPAQTLEIAQRFIDEEDLILLLIDSDKVKAPIKFEKTKSGRPGLFPHIYGALNPDAVYETSELVKNSNAEFIVPFALKMLASQD